jgi:hypothetical protein
MSIDQKRDFFIGFSEKKYRKFKLGIFFSFASPEHHRSRNTHTPAEIG